MKTLIGLFLILTALIGLVSLVKTMFGFFGPVFKKSTQSNSQVVRRVTRRDELMFWLRKLRAGKPAVRKRRWFQRKRPQAAFCS